MSVKDILLFGNGIRRCFVKDEKNKSENGKTVQKFDPDEIIKEHLKETSCDCCGENMVENKRNQERIPINHYDTLSFSQKVTWFYPRDEEAFSKEMKAQLDNYDYKKDIELNAFMSELLALNFDQILTTNYTLEVEHAIDPNFNMGHLNDLLKSIDGEKKKKDEYNIKQFVNIRHYQIWHIHGIAYNSKSMIYGFKSYLNYMKQIVEKAKTIIFLFSEYFCARIYETSKISCVKTDLYDQYFKF